MTAPSVASAAPRRARARGSPTMAPPASRTPARRVGGTSSAGMAAVPHGAGARGVGALPLRHLGFVRGATMVSGAPVASRGAGAGGGGGARSLDRRRPVPGAPTAGTPRRVGAVAGPSAA